jgi:hypothetical protein
MCVCCVCVSVRMCVRACVRACARLLVCVPPPPRPNPFPLFSACVREFVQHVCACMHECAGMIEKEAGARVCRHEE